MIKKKHKNLYKQRLHVKKNCLNSLNSIKLFLLFNTEYRDVAYFQYRDVQVPRCPDTIVRYAIVSSAKSLTVDVSLDWRSFM